MARAVDHRVIAWARSQKAGNAGAKAVLMDLAEYADRHGRCWPSQATIADDCEMHTGTVARHLATLQDLGLITRTRRTGPGGHRSSDAFQLMIDALPIKSQGRELQGRDADDADPTPQNAGLDTAPTSQSAGLDAEPNLANRLLGESPTTQIEAGLPCNLRPPTLQIAGVTNQEPSIELSGGTSQRNLTSDAGPVDNSPHDPTRCRDHQRTASPPPCRGCADAREAHRQVAAIADARAKADARAAERRARDAERRAAIDACNRCDDDGRVLGTRAGIPAPCHHREPGGRQRAEAAIAATAATGGTHG